MTDSSAISKILGLKRDLKTYRARNRELEKQLADERTAREKAESDLLAFKTVFVALRERD